MTSSTVEKVEGKVKFWSCQLRCWIILRWIWQKYVTQLYCIYLAEGEVLWQAFVNMLMNTRIIGRQGI